VGYGDVVPNSLLGRLLGALLIFFGIGVFALFTASLSAALIGRDLGDVRKEMSLVEKETHDLEKEENLVLKELNRLHERLDKLEAEIKKHSN
jgi:voltage-gated potassium channel